MIQPPPSPITLPTTLQYRRRFPDGTATSAVKIAAAQGGNAPVSDTEEALEALAWCSSHARAAVVAEAELVVDVAARDAEVFPPRSSTSIGVKNKEGDGTFMKREAPRVLYG